MMVDMCGIPIHAHFHDLNIDLDFEKVWNAHPSCSSSFCFYSTILMCFVCVCVCCSISSLILMKLHQCTS